MLSLRLIFLALLLSTAACNQRDSYAIAESFPPSRSFMVFFDLNSASLSAQSLQSIKQAGERYRYFESTQVMVTGHTDQIGSADYNLRLSIRRAAVVKDALIHEGIPVSAIVFSGRGDSQPLVQAEGAEAQNRRVEIVIAASGPKTEMRTWVLK